MENQRLIYHFSAIVGQEKMKNALVLNAIERIHGCWVVIPQ